MTGATMESYYDVIVCGAGPAGSTCALYLERAGLRVLLLEKEKFPRDKICADNKTWKCLDIVRELGLWKRFEKLPKQRIDGVLVASPSGHELYTPLLESDVREKGSWYNVRRVVFDAFLAEECKRTKRIVFRENCRVLEPIWKDKQMIGIRFLNESGKRESAYAKVVVGADGSASVIAESAGLSPKVKGRYAVNARTYYTGLGGIVNRCELYYLKGICPGYFWIFPVDNGLCNVGIGMRAEDIQKQGIRLEDKLEEIIQSEKFRSRFQKAKRTSEIGKWGLSVLGARRPCSGPGFILVGDAGTFAMTFSGEGVGPGMRSGKIAAQAIARAFQRRDFSAQSLHEYDEMLWQILEPEVQGFRWLEFLILHEAIFDWVLQRTARVPELVETSSRMQRDYSEARKMVGLATLWKLLKG